MFFLLFSFFKKKKSWNCTCRIVIDACLFTLANVSFSKRNPTVWESLCDWLGWIFWRIRSGRLCVGGEQADFDWSTEGRGRDGCSIEFDAFFSVNQGRKGKQTIKSLALTIKTDLELGRKWIWCARKGRIGIFTQTAGTRVDKVHQVLKDCLWLYLFDGDL